MPKKKRKEETHIVKRTSSVVARPDYLQGATLEPRDIHIEDSTLPLLKLLQSNSAEALGDGDEVLGRPGDFVIGLNGETFGRSVCVVPIVQKRKRIKWVDFDEGGGIDCISRDGVVGSLYGDCARCQYKEFGQKGKPPECMFCFDYLALAFDESELDGVKKGIVQIPNALSISRERGAVVLSCYMTKLKAARRLNAAILRSGLKMYTSVYTITSEFVQKDPYKWWVFKSFERIGFVSAELFNMISSELAPVLSSMAVTDYQTERPDKLVEEVEDVTDVNAEEF